MRDVDIDALRRKYGKEAQEEYLQFSEIYLAALFGDKAKTGLRLVIEGEESVPMPVRVIPDYFRDVLDLVDEVEALREEIAEHRKK